MDSVEKLQDLAAHLTTYLATTPTNDSINTFATTAMSNTLNAAFAPNNHQLAEHNDALTELRNSVPALT